MTTMTPMRARSIFTALTTTRHSDFLSRSRRLKVERKERKDERLAEVHSYW